MAEIEFSSDRRIQRVPQLLLKEEKNKEDYIPKVVSIGPYHHGKPELRLVEAFKPLALDLFITGDQKDQEFYYNKVLEVIGEIRNCYERQSTANYSDDVVARMMVHDACFIIIHMETCTPEGPEPDTHLPDPFKLHKFYTMAKHLDMLTMAIVFRDLLLLENQIPFSVVKLLINLRYQAGEEEKLLNRYMSMSLFGEYREKRSSPGGNRKEPLHLLEAFHRLVASDCVELGKTCLCFKCRWLCCFGVKKETRVDLEIGTTGGNQGRGQPSCLSKFLACKHRGAPKKNDAKRDARKYIHSFRSVTDLKAKGIKFKPSSTQSLMDVKFKSMFFYATLELPDWYVSIYTKVFFLNMIAYEMSPKNPSTGEVVSYINFMKSLIERPEDVKELREKKILYNTLGSDEEVLKVYKDINTFGANNPFIFHQVKEKIQAHYNSKMKTWMAELIHTHFRTPWTLIAFLAATTLLALASAQLYYSVHRKSK